MRGLDIDPETGDLVVDPQKESGMITRGLVLAGDIRPCLAELLLLANKGEFKEAPLIGGELTKIQSGTPDPFWASSVKRQMQECLIPVNEIKYSKGLIEIS